VKWKVNHFVCYSRNVELPAAPNTSFCKGIFALAKIFAHCIEKRVSMKEERDVENFYFYVQVNL
jgi:hypothetical protein